MNKPIREALNALGRPLTPKEESIVKWLLQWDKETVETVNGLFSAFFKAGQADAALYYQAEAIGSARPEELADAYGDQVGVVGAKPKTTIKPIGAIDGDKLDEWIEEAPKGLIPKLDNYALGYRKALDDLLIAKNTGIFDLPSDQGEATRLREALEKIVDVLADDTSINAQRINNLIIQALSSSHREDKGIQMVRDHYEYHRTNGNNEYANGMYDTIAMLGITIPGITEER